MPARPLETFASEGWYRPSSGRNEHYFRPTGHDEPALRSLCDHWSSSADIRPHLTPAVVRSACAACKEPWIAMLLAPHSEPWFPPQHTTLNDEEKTA